MTVSATVITDASYYRHPKKRRHCGGWAAYVRIDGVPAAVKGYGSIKPLDNLTSTLCEMYAAINGVWLAKRHGASQVLLRTDCQAVINAVSGVNLKVDLRDAWRRGLAEADIEDVTLLTRHVKGHSDLNTPASWANDWCDKHSRIGMRAARNGEKCLVLV